MGGGDFFESFEILGEMTLVIVAELVGQLGQLDIAV
jgi:hypothetical protein